MPYKHLFFFGLSLSTSLCAAFQSYGPGELLSSAPWVRVETWNDFDADGNFVLDTVACTQDNHWIFLEGGKLLITEYMVKCEPEMPLLDTIRGQWTLEDDDERLKISFAGGEEGFSMTVQQIELREAVFYFSGSEDPNDPVVRQRIILRR